MSAMTAQPIVVVQGTSRSQFFREAYHVRDTPRDSLGDGLVVVRHQHSALNLGVCSGAVGARKAAQGTETHIAIW